MFFSPAACARADPHVADASDFASRFAALLPDVGESVANGFSVLNRKLFINPSNKTNKVLNDR
jgi:hypothetical protein